MICLLANIGLISVALCRSHSSSLLRVYDVDKIIIDIDNFISSNINQFSHLHVNSTVSINIYHLFFRLDMHDLLYQFLFWSVILTVFDIESECRHIHKNHKKKKQHIPKIVIRHRNEKRQLAARHLTAQALYNFRKLSQLPYVFNRKNNRYVQPAYDFSTLSQLPHLLTNKHKLISQKHRIFEPLSHWKGVKRQFSFSQNIPTQALPSEVAKAAAPPPTIISLPDGNRPFQASIPFILPNDNAAQPSFAQDNSKSESSPAPAVAAAPAAVQAAEQAGNKGGTPKGGMCVSFCNPIC